MTPIELTEAQRRAIEAEHGRPVDLIDPATRQAYVLLAREQYEKVQSLLAAQSDVTAPSRESAAGLIAPAILRSQQAFWRNLPALLRDARNRGKWVCYHGDERVGVARTQRELIRECVRRGLPDDAYYTDVIEPRELAPWEVEEVEPLAAQHVDDGRSEP
jgi:hypothetical protein